MLNINRFLYSTFALVMVCLGVISPAQAQQYILRTSVLSAGGQQSTGGTLILQSTLGQPGVGQATAEAFLLDGGFWPQATRAAGPIALPTASDDTATTDEDTPIVIDVLANDTDPGGGAVYIESARRGDIGFVAITDTMTLVYSPVRNENGQDTFTYRIINDAGGIAEATVRVTVNPVNDVPFFSTFPPEGTTGAGSEYRYHVEALDADGDALTFTAPVLPSWLALIEPTDSTVTLAGTPTAAEAGGHPVTLTVSDGEASADLSFVVAVAALAAPVLLMPEDETLVDPTGGVTVAWQAAPGAATYILEVANVEDFSTLVIPTVELADTTRTLHGLQDNTLYFWRVAAVNDAGTQRTFSAPYRFSTAVNVATEEEEGVPTAFSLHANYPNPFNPTTTIGYDLPQSAAVRLVVYDLFGRAVKTLVQAQQGAGRYTVSFEAEGLASGTYFYRIEAGTWSQVRQLMLLK